MKYVHICCVVFRLGYIIIRAFFQINHVSIFLRIMEKLYDYPEVNVWSKRDLTCWGRVTHICVGNLTIIGSDYGLSPGRRQAIIWTNDGILLIGPLGTNFSEISTEIMTFSLKKIYLKVSSAKWRPFCLGLNVLSRWNRLVLKNNKI